MEPVTRSSSARRGHLVRLARRGAPVALAVALVAGAAACGSPAKVEVSAPSGTAAAGLSDGITVTGTGKVQGTPDTLTVSIGVSTKRPTVDAAVSDNAGTATALTAALTGNGVAAKDVQTSNYSVQQSFTLKGARDGFIVNNTVTVKIHDIAKAGAIIDAATAAGGAEVNVQGVSFTLEDNTALLEQARTDAYADAKAKADQFGQLSGRGLGDAQGISETVTADPLRMSYAADALSAAATTPINAGQVSTDVTITVRFALG